MKFINVYIEPSTLSLNRTFTYACDFDVQKGVRVLVPFGKNEYIGVVDQVDVSCDVDNVRSVIQVIDEEPLLNCELMDLAQYMANRYVCSLMACLKTMLPPALKPTVKHSSIVYEDWVVLNDGKEPLTKKQEEFLNSISSTLPRKVSEIRAVSVSMTKSLIDKGYLSLEKMEKRVPLVQEEKDTNFNLTDEQIKAIDTISNGRKNTYLLHGVTGSGKTEVFLQLAQKVIEQGKQVLFLVPEIGLTPLMIKRVSARFGNQIAIYHSQLSDQEKYSQYKLVKDNKVSIVVGTRSSVFMPFKQLGLILMDEEHDSSYKQDNTPRYVTKDIVLERARFHNCKVVLASATPSLDSYARAYKGVYQLVELKRRVFDNLPNIHVVDMKTAQVTNGISHVLLEQIKDRLQKGEQSILLLNRRGYLPIVRCSSCNEVITCPDCGIALTYHKKNGALECHCCGRTFYFNHECPTCHGREFYQSSMGTEKLEEKIQSLFPSANIVRMDADTTRKKNAHAKILKEFEQNGDILIGTQMVAKGLDFEKVTLVGILQADASLIRDDYSSCEITYQMLEQASGRAGRALKSGDVYIQTFDTNHYVMKSVIQHNYRFFFEKEMNYRYLGGYPPYCFMASIVYMGKDEDTLKQIVQSEMDLLQPLKVLGPVEISSRRQMKRARIVVKASSQEILNQKVWELEKAHQSKKGNIRLDINMYPGVLEG